MLQLIVIVSLESCTPYSSIRGLSEPGFECWAAVLKYFHSTLLQFTQMYKGVPGYRHWWICVLNCALIVAYGWMLPREIEMVSE